MTNLKYVGGEKRILNPNRNKSYSDNSLTLTLGRCKEEQLIKMKMQTREDYLNKDNDCRKAIDDFRILTSVPDWLQQYENLYDSVSIQPAGLPRITSSHFDNEEFENIQRFAHLYRVVKSVFE